MELGRIQDVKLHRSRTKQGSSSHQEICNCRRCGHMDPKVNALCLLNLVETRVPEKKIPCRTSSGSADLKRCMSRRLRTSKHVKIPIQKYRSCAGQNPDVCIWKMCMVNIMFWYGKSTKNMVKYHQHTWSNIVKQHGKQSQKYGTTSLKHVVVKSFIYDTSKNMVNTYNTNTTLSTIHNTSWYTISNTSHTSSNTWPTIVKHMVKHHSSKSWRPQSRPQSIQVLQSAFLRNYVKQQFFKWSAVPSQA
jgi:hypothetical protein